MPPHPDKQDKKIPNTQFKISFCDIQGKISEFKLVLRDTFLFISSAEDKDTSTKNVSPEVSLMGGEGRWISPIFK